MSGLTMSACFDNDGHVRCVMEGTDGHDRPVFFEMAAADMHANLRAQLAMLARVMAVEELYAGLLASGHDIDDALAMCEPMLPGSRSFNAELRVRTPPCCEQP